MGGVSARYLVGIDLGTTHTVVACADLGEAAPVAAAVGVRQLVGPSEQGERVLLASSLYAPTEAERALLPADLRGEPFVVGEWAKRRGAEVPGRLVSSAKSWLCHPGVDRQGAILPWGVDDESMPRCSPVEASARVLDQVRRSWDASRPSLAGQEVVLTVPASFDAVARELTVEAVRRVGLENVTLLEEPQAAFFDWMRRQGDEGLEGLLGGREAATVLVCDVGGGTTDFSLIRVERGASGAEVRRVAVGEHLLLGGDNMDLALAHLCEGRLSGEGAAPGKLSAPRFAQLVASCRGVKELLLGDKAPEEATVTLLGEGSRLLGATRRARLRRGEVEELLLDGFFPRVPIDSVPAGSRGALVSFGLPYARDAAVTRHLARFLSRHGGGPGGPAAPEALVLNGGVFHARAVAERLSEVLAGWYGVPPRLLPFADPDLSVARGAVAYGLARRGLGRKISGGSPRAYYVGAGKGLGVCLIPRGAEPGQVFRPEQSFSLLVGKPARFSLFTSGDEREDAPGAVVQIQPEEFDELPPVTGAIEAGVRGEIPVRLSGELTELGTLDVACVEQGGGRRFRLAFQLRQGDERASGPPSSVAPPLVMPGSLGPSSVFPASLAPRSTARPPAPFSARRAEEGRALIDRVFGKGGATQAGREVKDLLRDLEKALGERPAWSIELGRELFDHLMREPRSRRRSPEHERLFWLLSGYTMRPGLGHPGDPARVEQMFGLWPEGVTHKKEARVWQQFWIAWRRVAAGLSEGAQGAIRDGIDGYFRPASGKSKGKARPEAFDDLLSMACWLERPSAARRAELGGWLIERTWVSQEARLWEGIGRLGARVPVYTSAHQALPPQVVEPWLDELLKARWEGLSSAPLAAARMARMTGDRARDVGDRLRREVLRRLEASGARLSWVASVREVIEEGEAERAEAFGESLPVGLRLVDG